MDLIRKIVLVTVMCLGVNIFLQFMKAYYPDTPDAYCPLKAILIATVKR